MTYLTIDQLNSNTCYAPLGFEEEFETRIKNDIFTIIKNLNTTKSLKGNKINPVYFDIVEDLLDPMHLESGTSGTWMPQYRAGTHLEFWASWDDYGVYWKANGKGYQRLDLKIMCLNNFSSLYNDL